LVAAVGFAEKGHSVVGVDSNAAVVENLTRGVPHIYEPGLEQRLGRALATGNLRFTTDLHDAVKVSEVLFIAVGTPSDVDGSADLSNVLAVAQQVGEVVSKGQIVVLKSTVPVGTNARVTAIIRAAAGEAIEVVSNPEFLKEGTAVADFLNPDRVVIGSSCPVTQAVMRTLYAPFYRRTGRILFMDAVSAEITKYGANAMLATRISFMNEMADLCAAVGGDVDAVRRGMGADARIGDRFLFAGAGYGGSCFPKDVRALLRMANELDIPLRIAHSVDEVNTQQRQLVGRSLISYFKDRGGLAGKRVAVWGLAFKPNTDDMREAPARELLVQLLAQGAEVVAYDPAAMPKAQELFPTGVTFAGDLYAAVAGADALAIMTEWGMFQGADLGAVQEAMNTPVIFDGRNLFRLEEMRAAGFTYWSIGRPLVG